MTVCPPDVEKVRASAVATSQVLEENIAAAVAAMPDEAVYDGIRGRKVVFLTHDDAVL